MKPVATIVVIILIAVSVAHMLRLIFQIEIIAAGYYVPLWLSIFGFFVPAILALMLWREGRKEFIKTHLIPLNIIKK